MIYSYTLKFSAYCIWQQYSNDQIRKIKSYALLWVDLFKDVNYATDQQNSLIPRTPPFLSRAGPRLDSITSADVSHIAMSPSLESPSPRVQLLIASPFIH